MTTHPVPVARGDWQSSDLPDSVPDLPRRVPGARLAAQDEADRAAFTFAADPRAASIQAVRDYADWLEAHPDVPAPTSLVAASHPHEVSFTESVAVARQFAATYGATRHTNGGTGWVALDLGGDVVNVRHTVFTADHPSAAEGWL
jgi:hypothetical protein